MNYYSHRINDYRGKTSHLSLLEHGVYRQLLDTYYDKEGSIPTETEVVFRRLSARTEEEQNAVVSVLKDFFIPTEDGWRHEVCDEVISDYHKKGDVARENGKRGGRPSNKPQKTNVDIFDNPEETESKANHKPRTINQEPSKEDIVLLRLRGLFKMRPTTPIDRASVNAWKAGKQIALEATEQDWEMLEWHYSQPMKYQKRSISSLLNEWGKALQTAQNERQSLTTTSTVGQYDDAF